jgi:hypothetical protein
MTAKAVLVAKPALGGSELVRIRIDYERTPSTTITRPYWFHIWKSVRILCRTD